MDTTSPWVLAIRKPRWRALAPFAAGALLAAALGAAGFVLQAVSLPRPSSAMLAGVQAQRWLVRHRVVDSTTTIGRRTYSATCAGGWIGTGPDLGKRTRGSLLVTSTRDQLISIHGDVFRRSGIADDTPVAAEEVELAGCPFAIARILGNLLAQRRPLQLLKATIFGRAAYRFVLPGAGGAVDLYVARNTYAPLAVHLRRRSDAWSRLRQGNSRDLGRVYGTFAPATTRARTS